MSDRPGGLGRLQEGIDALPPAVVFALALAVSTVAGAAEESAGGLVPLTVLYLAAVAFASWFAGRAAGMAIALASAVSWLAARRATGFAAPSAGGQAASLVLELAAFTLTALVVAALRARRRHEASLARTDALTGLLNRRGFLEVARREVARSARTGRPLTVGRLDLGGFREVNDLRGQDAGDRVLGSVAAALRAAMRAVDVCARVGGDEFAVLLPDAEAEAVEAVLDRLRLVVLQSAAEMASALTVTLGAATFERPPMSLDETLRAADRVLQQAKSEGGNRARHERVA